jgi:wingless-type MMTV integration site family protein 8
MNDRADNLISNRLLGQIPTIVHSRVGKSRKNRRNSNSNAAAAAANQHSEMLRKLKRRKLVFLDESPDYCRNNSTAGFPGIIGRSVSSDPGTGESRNRQTRNQFKNFRKMCVGQCGLKIKRKILYVLTSCQCRFLWCCKVECETCRRKKIELTCIIP